MIRKLKVLLIFGLTFSISCNSKKKLLDSKSYEGLYYVTFYAKTEGKQPIIMSGIGEKFSLDKLEMTNLDEFVDSFYSQLYYSVDLDLRDSYVDAISCLNQKKKQNLLI